MAQQCLGHGSNGASASMVLHFNQQKVRIQRRTTGIQSTKSVVWPRKMCWLGIVTGW